MGRSEPPTELPATVSLFGVVCLGVAVYLLAVIGSGSSGGDDFGAGFAALGAFVVGTLGLVLVGFALFVSPTPAEAGDDVSFTVEYRPRLIAGVGVASMGSSLFLPIAVYVGAGMSAALLAWTVLVAAGALLVSAAFVWIVGEAVLGRAGVLN